MSREFTESDATSRAQLQAGLLDRGIGHFEVVFPSRPGAGARLAFRMRGNLELRPFMASFLSQEVDYSASQWVLNGDKGIELFAAAREYLILRAPVFDIVQDFQSRRPGPGRKVISSEVREETRLRDVEVQELLRSARAMEASAVVPAQFPSYFYPVGLFGGRDTQTHPDGELLTLGLSSETLANRLQAQFGGSIVAIDGERGVTYRLGLYGADLDRMVFRTRREIRSAINLGFYISPDIVRILDRVEDGDLRMTRSIGAETRALLDEIGYLSGLTTSQQQQISSFEAEREEHVGTIRTLQDHVGVLEEDLEVANKRADSAVSRADSLNMSLAERDRSLNIQAEVVTSLTIEGDAKDLRIEQLQTINEAQSEQVQILAEQDRNKDELLAEQSAVIGFLQEQNSALVARGRDDTLFIVGQERIIESLSDQLTTARPRAARAGELEAANESLGTENAALRIQAAEQSERVSVLGGRVEDLTTVTQEQDEKIEVLEGDLQLSQSNEYRLAAQNQVQSEKIVELSGVSTQQAEQISDLEAQLQSSRRSESALVEDNRRLSLQATNAEAELRKRRRNETTLERNNSRQLVEIDKLKETVEDLRGRLVNTRSRQIRNISERGLGENARLRKMVADAEAVNAGLAAQVEMLTGRTVETIDLGSLGKIKRMEFTPSQGVELRSMTVQALEGLILPVSDNRPVSRVRVSEGLEYVAKLALYFKYAQSDYILADRLSNRQYIEARDYIVNWFMPAVRRQFPNAEGISLFQLKDLLEQQSVIKDRLI